MTKRELTDAAKSYLDTVSAGFDPVSGAELDGFSVGMSDRVKAAADTASRQLGGLLSKRMPDNRRPGTVDRLYDGIFVLESLSAGRNPEDGEPLPKSDPMSSLRMRRCFAFAAEQVDGVFDKLRGRSKASFRMPPELRSGIAISDEPLIVTGLAKNINAANPDPERVNGVQAQLINDYLESRGLLEARTAPGAVRLPTDAGRALGLYVEPRQNKDGNVYDAVLFPPDAQAYVLDNLDGIEALARSQRADREAARQAEAKAAGKQSAGPAKAKRGKSRGSLAEAELFPGGKPFEDSALEPLPKDPFGDGPDFE